MKTVNEHIGQMVKINRENRRLSQAEMAEKMNVSQPYLSAIETGKQTVSIDQLVRIANILQCAIDIRFTPIQE